MLEYNYYLEKYPESKLTEIEFIRISSFVISEIKSEIVYKLDDIIAKDENFVDIIAMQVFHNEKNGTYFDGITTESVSSYSQSLSSDLKMGDFIWNKTVKKELLSYRYFHV